MNSNQNITVKGIVTITKRDAETLEIISERTVTNKMTAFGIEQFLSEISTAFNVFTSTVDLADIRSIGVVDTSTEQTFKSSTIQNTTFVPGSPAYFERIDRFNQPASTKSIRFVAITNSAVSGTNGMQTKVRLDPPCTQTNTEVLDITYRLQIKDVNDVSVAGMFARTMANNWLEIDGLLLDGHSFPRNAYGSWHGLPSVQYNQIRTRQDLSLPNVALVTPNQRDRILHRKILFDIFMLQADGVGRVFGSVIFGILQNDNQTSTEYFSNTHQLPAAPDGFVNTPVQPIHNHSVTATTPFLDVNNLATGTGSLSVDGDSWTDPDYPKYASIDIINTGDVGVARYSFRHRNSTGFSGNSYYSDPHTSIGFKYDAHPIGNHPSILNAHGLSVSDDLRQSTWDGRTLINVDDTGVTLIDIISGDYVIFDAITTPALPVTTISQVITDDNKNVWVADTASGLYKISDPYGTPTITKMTNAGNGIPVGGDTNCTCVGLGANNTVWALFDGGLGSTIDGGTSWTIYDQTSGHPFTHVGLTDANWTLGSRMCVDKESPNQELAISYTEGANEQLIWWSVIDVVAVGPLGSQAERLKCSTTGGLWQWDDIGSNDESFVPTRLLTYGTTASTNFGAIGGSNKRGLPVMVYDYYKSPYVFAFSDRVNNTGNVTSLFNVDRKLISQMRNFGLGAANSTRQMMLSMEDPSGLGKGLYVNRNNIDDSTSPALTNICPQLAPGTHNLRHSPYEDFVWDNYQWDGVNWVKDYHVDAIDTSGNSNDATRHNFDVEQYMFTGRSIIDVTPSFAASTFGTVATFAFTLTPEAKLSAARLTESAQEQPATIFEFNDGSGNRLILEWDEGSSNIVLSDESNAQIISAQPANGGTYRVIVTLNATDAKFYIDGVLTGTLTLAGAVDLSNTGSDFVCYIGSRTHAYSYNKRFNVSNFYRGDMNNIQLWNVEWDATDVTNDMVDITSVIASKPAINLISRYELTQSLVGLETKPTHAAQELLVDGVTLDFTDGATSPAFVQDEYYTVGLVDGFLKDNAMTITYRANLYIAGITDNNFTTITNAAGTNTVPGSSGSVTEPMVMHRYSGSRIYTQPGEIACSSSSGGIGAHSVQSSAGNFSLTFSPCWTNPNLNGTSNYMGFTDTVASTTLSYFSNNIDLKHHMRFQQNGTVDLYYANTLQMSAAATYDIDSVFTIERIGTSVSFYKVVLGVPQLLFTSGTSLSGIIFAMMGCTQVTVGFHNMSVTYDRSERFMVFGDESGNTGLFAPDYLATEIDPTIFANGIPLDVTTNATSLDLMTEPAPGTVTYNTLTGAIRFNAAEIGTTITGSVLIVKEIPE